jgi:DNA-binding PucR family transcriptional regulator
MQLLREATAKMTAEKSDMRLHEAEQTAAITCLKAELKVAQSDLQRAQKDTCRAAAAAAAAKSAGEAELMSVRDRADAAAAAAAAEVSRLEGVVEGLQQELQAARGAAEEAAGEVSAHLDKLAVAEARCGVLEDNAKQQVQTAALTVQPLLLWPHMLGGLVPGLLSGWKRAWLKQE